MTRWIRHSHLKSQRLQQEQQNSIKNIYVYKIGESLCYKLGQLCFIKNQGKICYKLEQLHYYKLGQVLLQIGAAVTNQGNRYYKIGQLLRIREISFTNWGRYYKLGQLLQIGAILTSYFFVVLYQSLRNGTQKQC